MVASAAVFVVSKIEFANIPKPVSPMRASTPATLSQAMAAATRGDAVSRRMVTATCSPARVR
jgi:hypothetical protein